MSQTPLSIPGTPSAPPRLRDDPWLTPYLPDLDRRHDKTTALLGKLTENGRVSLPEFALGHHYYGLHRTSTGWVFREWAPHASAIFLTGG